MVSMFLISCKSEPTKDSEPTEDPVISPVDEPDDIPTPSELLDDAFAVGNYLGDHASQRLPQDQLYEKLINRKEALKTGEEYVETFSESFLDSKLFPYKADQGASYEILNQGINEKTLVITTEGNYAGIYFNGMTFEKRSSYIMSFDYRLLSGTTEFFVQFRSKTGGVNSDVFYNLSSPDVKSGYVSFQVDLKNYSDYELMIFPRQEGGIFMIDNVSFERLNTRPMIQQATIDGVVAMDETLRLSYQYQDAEGDLEGATLYRWYAAMDAHGSNKTLISSHEETLIITPELAGKYIIAEIIPVAFGDSSDNNVGDAYRVVTTRVPGTVSSQVTLTLDPLETFVEDFESDVTVNHNLIFNELFNASAYIMNDNNNHVLNIEADTPYAGVTFSGLNLSHNMEYQIEFDFKLIDKPNTFYIQARTDTGYTDYDKFKNIDVNQLELDTWYHTTANFSLDDFNDYYLMLFFGSKPGRLVIDNLSVTHTGNPVHHIESKALEVGESLIETFDSPYPVFGFDTAQVPDSHLTDDPTLQISGNSYVFESPGSFKSLFINQGILYTSGATYRISFDYRVIEVVDTVYIQLNGGVFGNLYQQFAGDILDQDVHSFTYDFTLQNTTNYILQLFPGQSIGNTKVVLDNIKIERIN